MSRKERSKWDIPKHCGTAKKKKTEWKKKSWNYKRKWGDRRSEREEKKKWEAQKKNDQTRDDISSLLCICRKLCVRMIQAPIIIYRRIPFTHKYDSVVYESNYEWWGKEGLHTLGCYGHEFFLCLWIVIVMSLTRKLFVFVCYIEGQSWYQLGAWIVGKCSLKLAKGKAQG